MKPSEAVSKLRDRGQVAFNLQFDGPVAMLEFTGPEPNFLGLEMLTGLADALDLIDAIPEVRCTLLSAGGRHFCGGADFGEGAARVSPDAVYGEGLRIFGNKKPVVAALQGAVMGGGLGLALAADFRVVDETTRLGANFVALGMHPGFGLTLTLPALVGDQTAAEIFLTARRIKGEEAIQIGLADRMATAPRSLMAEARNLAREIAANAPLAVQATRATLRAGRLETISDRVRHETQEQLRLAATRDFREGVHAVAERRQANWTGE